MVYVYVVHIGPIVLIANAFKYVINIFNFILNNSFALSDNNVRYANLGLRKMVFNLVTQVQNTCGNYFG